MIKGNCTNRKCKNHIAKYCLANCNQINYIKDMLNKLDIDEDEYNFGTMKNYEASHIIQKLIERIELGE